MSLYDQLGQEPGISTAVDDFYRRVLADPSLEHYFKGADVDEIRAHQLQLLSSVSGGPAQYTGRALELSHRGLGVTGPDFDAVVGHLASTLDDLGAPADVRDQVTAVLEGQREHIVTGAAVTERG